MNLSQPAYWKEAMSGALVLAACLPLQGQAAEWGVDACLTRHIVAPGIPAYLDLIEGSGVRMLREREPMERQADGSFVHDVRLDYHLLRKGGHKIVAFTSLSKRLAVRTGDALPVDLLKVFGEGWQLAEDCAGLVDAWEMGGEPDIGSCTDLPDRITAYQKALYLGLKAWGRDRGAKSPIVLMGALGMPPGPWLERAAANGHLEYTDAYNFHFYGHAKDLTGVIEAHRAAIAGLSAKSEAQEENNPQVSGLRFQVSAAASLPLWITEAGLNAVPKDDFLNLKGRQLQAEFTVETAKQALAAPDVAVFMPFILVHKNDPYAMTLSADKPLPAWTAYAKFTRENPWPKRALAREAHAVNPVVMQWLPDNQTCRPRKVGGTYRFLEDQPIQGELRIYNFSDREVRGRLSMSAHSEAVSSELGAGSRDVLAVGPKEMKSISLKLSPKVSGFFRETISATFTEGSADNPQISGLLRHLRQASVRSQVSIVSFGVESLNSSTVFDVTPLALHALPGGVVKFPQAAPFTSSGQVGVWTLINGVKAKLPEPGSPQVSGLKPQVPAEASFWIEHKDVDPLAPTMAVAAVDGLPQAEFLRLELSKPMSKDCKVLVVLVDDRGQRYSIWENFGADYYGSRSDIWLNYEDIHADFWGPMSADYKFRPERIREVHLRFYLSHPNDPVGVKLSTLRQKT